MYRKIDPNQLTFMDFDLPFGALILKKRLGVVDHCAKPCLAFSQRCLLRLLVSRKSGHFTPAGLRDVFDT